MFHRRNWVGLLYLPVLKWSKVDHHQKLRSAKRLTYTDLVIEIDQGITHLPGRKALLRNLQTITITLVFILLSACAASTQKDSTPVWIDVRSQVENQQSSISGHANIPHTQISREIAQLVPDKNTPVILYCRSGGRAGKAKTALEDMGYTQVTNAGGIEDVRESLKSD
jgi:phage shock protein E